MKLLSDDKLARLRVWLSTAPRSAHDWLAYTRRLGIPPTSRLSDAIAELEATGVEVLSGEGSFRGRRCFWWVDSNRASLRRAIRFLSIVEIGFDDLPAVSRRRRVRRGKVG